ncbi:ABC transporter permease [Shinella sp. NM-101]|uniref:ABC transporter permease n=1 Tax=Shinella sp. NM-101 TaxID=2744455 RepID=UPI001F48B9A6|nr:ABC transporter permease [Shinella sp. NM-101]
MSPILAGLGWTGRYLWAGWAGLAGIFCFLAVWQAGHEIYGSFILPSPAETAAAIGTLVTRPDFWTILGQSAGRALSGFALAAVIGTMSGLLAGYSFAAMRLMKPVVTVMLGVPPIGWIVLALIWFGSSGGTAVMTVVIASAPLSFAGALEGVAKRDRQLDIMAQSFGASWLYRLRTITLPHVLSYLFPAWTTTAGSAWKVTVMAELLSNSGGIGGELATARALFDIPLVTAWLAITVMLALATDYGVLHVVREAAERWRSAGLPWGVKR